MSPSNPASRAAVDDARRGATNGRCTCYPFAQALPKRRRSPPGSSCGWAAREHPPWQLPATSRRAPDLSLTSQIGGFLYGTLTPSARVASLKNYGA